MKRPDATLPVMQRNRATIALSCALLAATSFGCATRVVKTPIVESERLEVALRHSAQGGTAVERDFQHPANISSERLSHILGAIDIQVTDPDKQRIRLAAIHPELLQPVSRAMSRAFAKADSSQEVIVIAVRKQQRLGIFNKKYLTTLTAFFRNDRLYVHLSRVEWEIPKDRKNKVLPQPHRGEKQMAFRTAPGRKMTQAGSQGVAIRWHDPLFSLPVRSASSVGGPRQQRTILMDSPIPPEEADDEPQLPSSRLSPETLRALADLEEERRAGKLTEAEYEHRREALLGTSGP